MKRLLTVLVILISSISCFTIKAQNNVSFHRLGTHQGLSNSQVNCVFKDSKGYIWFGTQSGLDRFDGFRFKNFFYKYGNDLSLPNNAVDRIQEDINGNLWIHTAVGYCVYMSDTENFNPGSNQLMQAMGMNGTADWVEIDSHKNMWVAVNGRGVYYNEAGKNKSFLFKQDGNRSSVLPSGMVSCITECKGGVIITFNNGILAKLSSKTRKVEWVNKSLFNLHKGVLMAHSTYVDLYGNIWVSYVGHTVVWSCKTKQWYNSVSQIIKEFGIKGVNCNNILVKDLVTDNIGRIWIATDHDGMLMLDTRNHTCESYKYDKTNSESIPDNTIQNLFLDNNGALWVGTYKNGVAFYSAEDSKFSTIYLGDVCTIVEDNSGNLWCGTNNEGIVVYNPLTGVAHHYRSGETGLGSEAVISSTIAKDGSLWFGTFNGGMTHYKDGRFTPYRATGKPNSLANDNVWALETDTNGNIVIATLGGGLQFLNTLSDKFTTYNSHNSGLLSDFILSISFDGEGNIVIGNAQSFSVLDVKTRKITKYNTTRSGHVFSASSINQILVDSRGIVWNASASGLSSYELKGDSLNEISLFPGSQSFVASSVIEDLANTIWVATDKGVSHIVLTNEDGKWNYFVTNYNEIDGLQNRQFNSRAIFLCHNGNVVVGGQDGINIIPPQKTKRSFRQSHALFAGFVLYDKSVDVGEEYNGRVILDKALRDGGSLTLNHSDDAFTILLASDNVSIPEKSKFLYRLKGFSDKWMLTADGQPAVSFTNLSSGDYKLEVKVVNRDGTQSDIVSTLDIHVNPPFYLSIWAILFYVVLVAVLLYYAKIIFLRRQKEKFMIEQVKRDAEQSKHLDEMKLNFFTNVSHELRTPITLIISPLNNMIKNETDGDNKNMLELIQRNAKRLLNMVNQILDFRKMDENQQQLNLLTGDIVEFVKNICNTFNKLVSKDITLTFYSSVGYLFMSFDDDKIGKIINNLLSNAYKFTPSGGRIDVSMRVISNNDSEGKNIDMLEMKVSDTGVGINDEEKTHVFDRFYQVNSEKGQTYGGSGIGLSLVKTFVDMHGGTVSVSDNPGGGAVFVIYLPIRHDSTQTVFRTEKLVEKSNEEVRLVLNHDENNVNNKDIPAIPVYANLAKSDVLVVDDSDDFLSFMTEVLSTDYNVRVAHNGIEALKLVAEKKPDIILSDVMMPEMDGNQLCKELKSDINTSGIPFIILTARMAQEHKIEGLENGADDYITKPFNMDLLNLKIQNLIKWHKGPRQKLIKPKIKQLEITSVDQQMVNDATKYVEDNLDNTDISVETLSADLNMSRVQLYKRLLSVTGTTPSEFIRTIRLQHAEQLLRQSQQGVSEIAYQVGFNNPRYFSKYFTEMYGVTPSQYKHKFEKDR
ncbi:hybrid sensor histidine kinase/response regulator [Prevotella herbatica]|uniref:histidine kinase n=1 Tax=Prevotella herbatica TaxID=2801997 RepID=A0ABM7NZU8_9BACT|nr:ATP-binding protein [Prevotella herbatica]BCS86028.1 hybrid sensor histidine kinase/response regulator [Prevotella herbatica]